MTYSTYGPRAVRHPAHPLPIVETPMENHPYPDRRGSSRRALLTTALGTTAAVGLAAGTASAAPAPRAARSVEILGREVDVTHATPDVVRLFASYFEAKTARDVEATMAHFAPHITYVDATLGWPWYNWQDLHDLFAGLMPTWPATSASYPTRIVGDASSAVVFFTDTPELFGHEIRPMGAVDFERGRIVRWVDYWDGRAFTLAGIEEQRTPADRFPTDFKEAEAGEKAPRALRSVVRRLVAALDAGDTDRVTDLFHPDAVLEDLALHTVVTGRHSIASFLNSALSSLPYGPNATVRHVLGTGRGGGFEWTNPSAPAPRGITSLTLDDTGAITRMTSVWDSSLWTASAIGRAQSATVLG
ncbi:nuclear transport factor 2 family protein [Streptomyces sp. NPDC026672]|uniref:nuclear transport factor 2 family protein n=1 Tax=unclassified Streptomyces TaxID=2593676 RepID=UPI0033D3FA73